MKTLTFAIAGVLLAGVVLRDNTVRAESEGGEAAMLAALAKSRHSLVDGIRQAAGASGAAISAKFEDEGKGLSLSVYVAGKGLGVKADENVLTELAGSPTAAEWKPAREVFEDVEHVARSAEQLTLMRLTSLSLVDAVERAEKLRPGTAVSVTPELRGTKAVFRVRIASDGKVADILLDLTTGAPVAPTSPKEARG